MDVVMFLVFSRDKRSLVVADLATSFITTKINIPHSRSETSEDI